MDLFNHNQQNCRAKFVPLSPMQNSELFDHSIACRNYEILRLNYKSSLQHENLTDFENLSRKGGFTSSSRITSIDFAEEASEDL